MIDTYQISTDKRIIKFANSARFPGWYIDSNGCYCCVVGKYLISIFINDMDDNMDITVDAIGERGYFDKNLEWESPEDEESMMETACRFMSQYANRLQRNTPVTLETLRICGILRDG